MTEGTSGNLATGDQRFPTLPEIIERLTKATEPDRELDLAIQLAIEPSGDIAKLMQYRRGFNGEGFSWEIYQGSVCFQKYDDNGRCNYNGGHPLPRYTSSIDDALKLLRKHYLWEVKQGIGSHAIVWWIEKDWDDTGAPTGYSTVYPAMALAIAALIARAVEDRALALVGAAGRAALSAQITSDEPQQGT